MIGIIILVNHLRLIPYRMGPVIRLDTRFVRRLAVARAGLLRPERTGIPRRAAGTGPRARATAGEVVRRFGYLQLDTVSVTGARSHALVLMSRLDGASPALCESLLRPGGGLFEYWGHEASWLPIELYPYFDFRRQEFRVHPWWGDILGDNPRVADAVLRRLRDEGPLRSSDFRSRPARAGWWDLDVAKKVISALWSRGDVAVRQRVAFQREYDLAENVIPARVLSESRTRSESVRHLLLRALAGHGWATTGTLAATWRFRNMGDEVGHALQELADAGSIREAEADLPGGRRRGWIRTEDLELGDRLRSARPRRSRGCLLSPFDPLIWDRVRTEQLFGFRQAIEIYKPKAQREFGYYCMPVLAGDLLVGRIDLKAHRRRGQLAVVSHHWEQERPPAAHRVAAEAALRRLAAALDLRAGPLG